MRVVCILTDKNNKTVGAHIVDDLGRYHDLSTEQLRLGRYNFDNATVDSNGYVRAKRGSLDKVRLNTKSTMREQADIANAKKVVSENPMVIYHGTKEDNLVPEFGGGKPDCDYGKGFYTTPKLELAKEWAWSGYAKGDKGYVYTYHLDTTGLNILDLTKLDCTHWIAELLANRKLNTSKLQEVTRNNVDAFLDRYKLNTSKTDVIIGYRADDSYFAFAEGFVSGQIYFETLESALRLGDLGIQVCVKSRRAFSHLKHVDRTEVDKKYESLYIKRDQKARNDYSRMARSQVTQNKRTIVNFI